MREAHNPQTHMWLYVFIKHHKYIRIARELTDRHAHAGRSQLLGKPPMFSSSAIVRNTYGSCQ